MTDEYLGLSFSQASAGETAATKLLAVLAAVCKEGKADHVDFRDLRVWFDPAGPMTILLVPADNPQWNVFLESCSVQARSNVRTFRSKDYYSQALVGSESLTQLLLRTGAVSEAQSPVDPDEFLVLGKNLSEPDAAAMISKLLAAGTMPQVASAVGKEGRRYHLIHVRADPSRTIGLGGLRAGGVFESCDWLSCITDPHRKLRIFVPEVLQGEIGAKGARAIFEIVQAKPEVLRNGAVSDSGLLFGIVDASPKDAAAVDAGGAMSARRNLSFETIDLSALVFEDVQVFTPGLAHNADITTTALAPDETAQLALRAAIEAAADEGVGYRLQLLRSDRDDFSQMSEQQLAFRKQQLDEEVAEIAYYLEAKESERRPRPQLYRFRYYQTQAMADFLRCFPLEVIRSETLKYAFEADTVNSPNGTHYLLVWPREAQLLSGNPLPRWHSSDADNMEFWLEPDWAYHYYERGNNNLLFVPFGAHLTPSLHAWQSSEMDQYLEHLMSELGGEPVPAPLYIFDGKVGDWDNSLHVTQLSSASFRPLKTELRWLNDNLTLLHASSPVRPLLEESAGPVLDSMIRSKATDAARTAGTRFQKVLTETQTASLNSVREVFADINRVMNTNIDQAIGTLTQLETDISNTYKAAEVTFADSKAQIGKFSASARDTQKALIAHSNDLVVLKDLAAEMSNTVDQLHNIRQQAKATLERLQTELGELQRQTGRTRDESGEIVKAASTIGDLQQKYARLKQELDALFQ